MVTITRYYIIDVAKNTVDSNLQCVLVRVPGRFFSLQHSWIPGTRYNNNTAVVWGVWWLRSASTIWAEIFFRRQTTRKTRRICLDQVRGGASGWRLAMTYSSTYNRWHPVQDTAHPIDVMIMFAGLWRKARIIRNIVLRTWYVIRKEKKTTGILINATRADFQWKIYARKIAACLLPVRVNKKAAAERFP